MDKYLNREIKEVVEEHPLVGEILNEYDISCATCSVGTCMLQEVVKVHFLPPEIEEPLMQRIELAILTGRDGIVASGKNHTGSAELAGTKNITYAEPILLLVNEHKLIKRLLAAIPAIEITILQSGLDQQMILDCIDFIRNYADRFHHAKEEDIMFKYVDQEQDIIKAMLQEHENGRCFAKSTLKALSDQDTEKVIRNLQSYKELLEEHIRKEDELLYPWIERQMSIAQLDEMHKSFANIEAQIGINTAEKYEKLIETIESRINNN